MSEAAQQDSERCGAMAPRVAVCFFVADTRHRIPRRPWWRWLYRKTRSVLLRAVAMRRGPEPREVDYAAGLEYALASLRRRSPNLPRVLLLCPDDIARPEGVDEVIRIDPKTYRDVRGVAYEFGVTVFYKLELFRLRGYDRIIYFDSDLLFVDDVSALWDPQCYGERDLWAVRESPANGATFAPSFGTLNSGVLVINAAMLGDDVHARLLATATAGLSSDGGDQGVLHRFLEAPGTRQRAGELDPSFNLFAHSASITGGLLDLGAKVLHFTGSEKPFGRAQARRDDDDGHDVDELYFAIAGSTAPRPLAEGVAALLASTTVRD